ncbi:hypothetical protein ABTK15_20870, partial [Acinetobacter baumannii]
DLRGCHHQRLEPPGRGHAPAGTAPCLIGPSAEQTDQAGEKKRTPVTRDALNMVRSTSDFVLKTWPAAAAQAPPGLMLHGAG